MWRLLGLLMLPHYTIGFSKARPEGGILPAYADLCLQDLGSEDLEEWSKLQSNAIDNPTSVSVYFLAFVEQSKQ